MQIPVPKAVECPRCGEQTDVSIPAEDVELKIRRSVAAFGDHETVTCSNGHRYWVYFC